VCVIESVFRSMTQIEPSLPHVTSVGTAHLRRN
jgi:hypothetical protein